MENLQIINLVITVLLALVAFFGGMTIKGLSDAVGELRKEDKIMRDRFDQFVKVDVLEAWRKEQREISSRIFDKLEQIQKELGHKVDRSECRSCREGGQ